MTRDEIQKLEIKPDLRKAMLYVLEQEHVAESNSVAEKLADRMQEGKAHQEYQLRIYRYNGMDCMVRLPSGHSVDLRTGVCFGVQGDSAFINHNWCKLKDNMDVLPNSTFQEVGSPTRLNQMNQMNTAPVAATSTLISHPLGFRIQR